MLASDPSIPSNPAILIQGIGAMGGVVATRLLEAGLNPTLVAGSERNAATLNKSGLRLRAAGEEIHQEAIAYSTVEATPADRRFDYVLILTKALNLESAVRAALPRAHDSTVFVAMQNGIVEPLVVEIVGRNRVIPSLLNWAATMHELGFYEQSVAHSTVLGEFDGTITPRLRQLGELLKTVTPISLSPNILGAQWAKLQMNCSVTALVTLCGTTLVELLDTNDGREIFVAVCREVLDVADAADIRLEKLAVDPQTPRTATSSHIHSQIRQWLTDVRATYGNSRPSLLQDLERGKLTEIDFITGHVVQTAKQFGASAPLCDAVTRMIHEIESHERRLTIENIRELRGWL